LSSQPAYDGPSRVRALTGNQFRGRIAELKSIVLGRRQTFKKQKKSQSKSYKDKNMLLVEFYSNFAENCVYLKPIWAA
jgi:hypothetical protein